jgi:hypothetical protein
MRQAGPLDVKRLLGARRKRVIRHLTDQINKILKNSEKFSQLSMFSAD